MGSSIRSAWLLRPYIDEKLSIETFKELEIVGIGWGSTGSCKDLTKTQLRNKLIEKYSLNGVKLGNAILCFEIFLKMKVGDLVLVPSGIDEIDIAEVSGDYYFDDDEKNTINHKKKVSWFPETRSRNQLSNELRDRLKIRKLAADLSEHIEEINILSTGKPNPHIKPYEFKYVEYPLRPNLNVSIKIPNDMTEKEAMRLSRFFRDLYFDKK